MWSGTVVGVHGDDVFVELGPRMQGVISRRRFESAPPELGEVHEFTLRVASTTEDGEETALRRCSVTVSPPALTTAR